MTTPYNALIADTLNITPERARLVEAYLRMDYGTLDHLSRRTSDASNYHGGVRTVIDIDLESAIALADSYGLTEETTRKKTRKE